MLAFEKADAQTNKNITIVHEYSFNLSPIIIGIKALAVSLQNLYHLN